MLPSNDCANSALNLLLLFSLTALEHQSWLGYHFVEERNCRSLLD